MRRDVARIRKGTRRERASPKGQVRALPHPSFLPLSHTPRVSYKTVYSNRKKKEAVPS